MQVPGGCRVIKPAARVREPLRTRRAGPVWSQPRAHDEQAWTTRMRPGKPGTRHASRLTERRCQLHQTVATRQKEQHRRRQTRARRQPISDKTSSQLLAARFEQQHESGRGRCPGCCSVVRAGRTDGFVLADAAGFSNRCRVLAHDRLRPVGANAARAPPGREARRVPPPRRDRFSRMQSRHLGRLDDALDGEHACGGGSA